MASSVASALAGASVAVDFLCSVFLASSVFRNLYPPPPPKAAKILQFIEPSSLLTSTYLCNIVNQQSGLLT